MENKNNNSEPLSQKDKWSMFRNFMYNELGITKADIRIWIQEAVREETKRLIGNTYNDFNVRKMGHEEMRKVLKSWDFQHAVANEIANRVTVGLKDKE